MEESKWIIQIQSALNNASKEDELHISTPIICVPEPLRSTKLEAYTPQLIALGPYHHNREELHHIDRYKTEAANKLKTELGDIWFVVDAFRKLEHRIRAHYYKYLPFNGETLALMMTTDASFLLNFMQSFSTKGDNNLTKIPSEMGRLADPTRRTSTHDMLIHDVVMLENQLPLFLLHKILQIQLQSPYVAEETLVEMLIALLNELTPFKMARNSKNIETTQYSHILELLYHSIVPLYEDEPQEESEVINQNNRPHKCSSNFLVFKEFMFGRVRAFMSLLLNTCMKIPTVSFLILAVKNMCVTQTDININQECLHGSNQGISFEEISIPSVTELANAGVRFEPTQGDISSITFDAKTGTLYLPTISLNVNAETVLRNLVAYEAMIVTGPLSFTRYIEFMNGIIDTEEDAKVLRENEVLVNGLRSDKEVAEMWNGMSRSIRLTRVRVLDEMIEEINKYYNGKWKVKIGMFVRKYILRSWEYVLAAVVILMLVIIGFQVFSIGITRIWGYRGRGRSLPK